MDDFALDAILELERIWDEKRGRVTLRDLGLSFVCRVRWSGDATARPQQWRAYPGRRPVRVIWVEDA